MIKPDKIFIDNFSCYAIEPRENDSIIAGEEVCYIRMDAVLNIIKEQKKIAMGFAYEHLKMIENKINTL